MCEIQHQFKGIKCIVENNVLNLSGSTYKHRDGIKSVGGKWNKEDKIWEIQLNNRPVEMILEQIEKFGKNITPSPYDELKQAVEKQKSSKRARESEKTWIEEMKPKWQKMVIDLPPSKELHIKELHRSLLYRDGISLLSGPWEKVKSRICWGTILAKHIDDNGLANVIFGITYD